MNEWLAPSVIIGLLTAGGAITGVSFNRRNSKDTLLLASRDEHIDDLREDLNATREEMRKMRAEVQEQGRQVQEQGEQIRQLQVQEWGLRRYVHKLLDFIRGLGEEPPKPPTELKL